MPRSKRLFILAAALSVTGLGCKCTRALQQVADAELTVQPSALDTFSAFVGFSQTLSVTVTNRGGAPANVDLRIEPLGVFTASIEGLQLGSGDSVDVDVTFSPNEVGSQTAKLTLGDVKVLLVGEALEVPECITADVCSTNVFDSTLGHCVAGVKRDGAACETGCVKGECVMGTCRGPTVGCDDGDACTVDGCSDLTTCTWAPRECPKPSNPCEVARCDSATGCVNDQVDDGVLCGPDDCLATQVDVCLAGECVKRTRPDTGRCANRWLPTTMPPRAQHAMAFDVARQGWVVFGGTSVADTWTKGGSSPWELRISPQSPPARESAAVWNPRTQRVFLVGGGETWEWDGTNWLQRLSASAPSARTGHRLVWDEARNRVVLFAGHDGVKFLADTWEWDGLQWLERTPTQSPSPRRAHAMAWDSRRQRTVLFGGNQGLDLDDTWTWDGSTWTQMTPSASPLARDGHAMTWDAKAGNVVLFGGINYLGVNELRDTWVWDGTTWVAQMPPLSPSPRFGHALSWNPVRQRVTLVGGYTPPVPARDSWEWDGTSWTDVSASGTPTADRQPSVSWDERRQEMVVFGGWHDSLATAETWAWHDLAWSPLVATPSPSARGSPSSTWDATHEVTIVRGGCCDASANWLTDMWTWDGARWASVGSGVAPPPRRDEAVAWDRKRQRLVLFGGATSAFVALNDTWEWDGLEWAQRMPTHAPSTRFGSAMAWDPVQDRLVLFGGVGTGGSTSSVLNDTWEWDGVDWTKRTPATAPSARMGHRMTWDPRVQSIVLFGGSNGLRYLQQTWDWNGTAWTQRTPTFSPNDGNVDGLEWDSKAQRLSLYTNKTWWLYLP